MDESYKERETSDELSTKGINISFSNMIIVGLCGLTNVGNTCYLNSGISKILLTFTCEGCQALFAQWPLSEYLLNPDLVQTLTKKYQDEKKTRTRVVLLFASCVDFVFSGK